MPIKWNPFDWFSDDDDDGDEEYNPLEDAEEILEIINDPDFDGWDELGQIPKTDPGRRDPDTGPLRNK